jgi:hypothetical protein
MCSRFSGLFHFIQENSQKIPGDFENYFYQREGLKRGMKKGVTVKKRGMHT